MRRSTIGHTLAALLCLAAALGIAACGGDDESTSTGTVASHPDLDRYCELVVELNHESTQVFNQLGANGVPSNDELAAAQVQILDDNAELIDEMAAVAPTEIRDDFELSLDSARQRAEAGDASQPPKDVAEANVRLQQFRRDNCNN